MDENVKKPKRPRIGESNGNLDEQFENGRYEKVEYSAHEQHQGEEPETTDGLKQQEDYQPRQQGGYQRQGGYQQRPGGYHK